MKRALVVVAAAALVVPAVLAGPAHAADPDTAGVSADNSSGTECFQGKAQVPLVGAANDAVELVTNPDLD